MFTIKIEFVHKMHYFKEQCETEERWRAQLSVSAVIAKMHGIADLARVRWRFAQQILTDLAEAGMLCNGHYQMQGRNYVNIGAALETIGCGG